VNVGTIVSLSLACTAFTLPGIALAAPAPETGTTIASVDRGERVYRRACAACHGREGRGDGAAARYLDPRPRDFTSGRFRSRSTRSGPPTDDDLYRIVTHGVPRTHMPGSENLLSERQRRDVVAYIKTLSDVFDSVGKPLEVPADPGATHDSIAEGKNVYILMQCFKCHGGRGRGDGPSAASLRNVRGERIEAFDFTVGSYKWGKDGQSIFKTFEIGLNGTPMPSYADAFLYGREDGGDLSGLRSTYSETEVASLASYLESQPTAAQLTGLPEPEREQLVNQRKWALVHFVSSLSRESGLWRRLFVEDTEVTR